MPKLDTTIHLDMFKSGMRQRSLANRIKKAISILTSKNDLYGLEWGDPDSVSPLRYVRNNFLTPYITPDSTVVEIGPGGGRWTRYMLPARKVYAVDYHEELLKELRKNFKNENICLVKNNGDDFPGIQKASIDFIFSFGTFVHLDLEIIDGYLKNMKPLLKNDANVVIQYSDKNKPIAKRNKGFSDNDPDKMRGLVLSHGYSIFEEDIQTMWHSAIIRFGLSN